MSAGNNTKQLSGGGIRGVAIQGCAIGNWPPLTFGEPYIPVTSIAMPSTGSVRRSRTLQVVYSVAPANATDKTIIWGSSDTSVATVSSTGLITGVKIGQCFITATSVDGPNRQLILTVTS